MHRRVHVRNVKLSDWDLPEVGVDRAQVSVEIDGKAVLRGSRSRAVYAARALSEVLEFMLRTPSLAVLYGAVSGTQPVTLSWSAPASGALVSTVCLGDPTLEELRVDQREVAKDARPVAFEKGQVLHFVMSADAGVAVNVELVLVLDLLR